MVQRVSRSERTKRQRMFGERYRSMFQASSNALLPKPIRKQEIDLSSHPDWEPLEEELPEKKPGNLFYNRIDININGWLMQPG